MVMNRVKVVFVETRVSMQCMYSKIGRNVKFYLSVNRFGTGYSHTILLPPSYHIKIGSEFPTMQFVGLALYSNGVHFLRNSLLECLSLSLRPPSAPIY
jgi:hypothetical protein